MIVRKIRARKLVSNAVIPKASNGNVGFDISSIVNTSIAPGRTEKINTGIALSSEICPVSVSHSIPGGEDFYGVEFVPFLKVEGRSSLASKGVFPVGGILDPSYRGEVIVVLHNSSNERFYINEGDRIAQLVCYYTMAPVSGELAVEFEESDSTVSDRGENGFGSTGK